VGSERQIQQPVTRGKNNEDQPFGVSRESRAIRWFREQSTLQDGRGHHRGRNDDPTSPERGADMTPTLDANPLTALDRCDRCGAQAYVRTVLSGGSELLFCSHHWHENEPRLRELAVEIHDETGRLAAVPAVAAADER
jgi:hypothetical protein